MIGRFRADVQLVAAAQDGNLREVRKRALPHLVSDNTEAPYSLAYAVLIALYAGHDNVARWLLDWEAITQQHLDGTYIMAQTQARHGLNRTRIAPAGAAVLAEYGLQIPDLPYAVG